MELRPSRFKIGMSLGISAAYTLMVLLTTIGICLVVFLNTQRILREELRKQISSTVATAALLVDGDRHDNLKTADQETSPIYREEKARLAAVLQGAPQIRFIYTMRRNEAGGVEFVVDAETDPDNMSHIGDVYDSPTPELLASLNTGTVQVETNFTTDEWGTWLSGFAPIRNASGHQVGILGIDMSAGNILKNERDTLGLVVLMATIFSALVLVLGIWLSLRITTPLKKLEQEMTRIQKFDIEGVSVVNSIFREISSIAATIVDVRQSLRSFRRYVPADLVAQLVNTHQLAGLGGKRQDLTIFFSDIENFTTWSEYLDPEELIGVIARYFAGMTEIIHRHHGTVDKYIGDAIMAFWGAPVDLVDHAWHACNAALECLQFQHQLNQELASQGLAEINTRIGLNSGEVLVGNVGYEERLNYTVLGDHVNIASRLEDLNKYYQTNIIISANTADRVVDRFRCRSLDKVVVKGRSRQIQIFELRGHSVESDNGMSESEFVDLANQAAELYFSRHWAEALLFYEKILASRPHDKPSSIMLERCRKLVANDPGPDWQGYIVLRDK